MSRKNEYTQCIEHIKTWGLAPLKYILLKISQQISLQIVELVITN